MSATDIEWYLRRPWTVIRETRQDDGTYIVLRIKELPGFVVAGHTPEDVDQEYWEALELHVRSYLEDGEEPPLPEEQDDSSYYDDSEPETEGVGVGSLAFAR